MKNLPLGIQTFRDIVDKDNNYYYVDKTKFAYDLVTNNKYKQVFLTRPRRFGKSLFLSTLKELFKGNKQLFEGLYIYDKWNWEDNYPVIHIIMPSSYTGRKTFNELLTYKIKFYFNAYGMTYDNSMTHKENFCNLIKNVYTLKNKKVVILIDEYNKPILDRVEDKIEREWAEAQLTEFYSCLNELNKYIRFAFLTGVSKFNQVSIFSCLNKIVDISLTAEFGDICGFTNSEFKTVFEERLKNVEINKIKQYYDGYNFNGQNVYTPQDILHFFCYDFHYGNYWFSSGSFSYLIKLMEDNKYGISDFVSFSPLKTHNELLSPFSVENLDLAVLLYQSGYLTISEKEVKNNLVHYKLDFPNLFVKSSFYRELCKAIIPIRYYSQSNNSAYEALYLADFKLLEESIQLFFEGIQYQNNLILNDRNKFEDLNSIYISLFFSFLQSLGFYCKCESITNNDRLDMYLKVSNYNYIIEFKASKSDAIAQIEDKKYYEKYLDDTKRELYIVGINFDVNEKNISKVEYKKI